MRRGAGAAAAAAALGVRGFAHASPAFLVPGLPTGEYSTAVMATLQGKKPLIKLAYRPPNYEAPLNYFSTVITPNDEFFVRYHLAGIPARIDASAWKLDVGGEGATTPFQLTLADLQHDFEQVEITAVCQCSGNRRGLSTPHVPGVQWGVGAMANGVWKGVRLKDVLSKVGLRSETVEIVVNGADGPVLTTTPDFVKSIPIWKALDENTLIAFQLNGEPIPHFNGHPARLIVPGWTATYWMKHLISIEAVTKPFDGFWVKTAYRIPTGAFALVQRFLSQETETSTPITEIVVNSLVTSPVEGETFRPHASVAVAGIAWDAGYGIQRVEISTDDGATWDDATLGEDAGRFSFRPFTYRFTAGKPGGYSVRAKATNRIGETQVQSLIFNGAGYNNNVIRPTNYVVA
jgi:DMSO/TMAO reductase YedYZ molybdopterin-dependent catalytic subunit